MKLNKFTQSLDKVKNIVSHSKESALTNVHETKDLIVDAMSNKSSIRQSFKGVLKNYWKIGVAIPKSLAKLVLTRDIKGSLKELSNIPKGSLALMASPLGLARSTLSSAKSKVTMPLKALKEVSKLPLSLGPVVGNTINAVSDLLPTGGTKPAKQADPVTKSAEDQKDLTNKILPSLNNSASSSNAISQSVEATKSDGLSLDPESSQPSSPPLAPT